MSLGLAPPAALALRDYQQDALTAITAAWLRGVRRPLTALPTGAGLVYLEPIPDVPDRWRVRYKAKDATRKTLRDGLDLGYAQGFAEQYARSVGAGVLVDPDARWRREPATEAQLSLLQRSRIPITPGLTKGEATDLIAAASLNWN